jgi:hypothetical protein
MRERHSLFPEYETLFHHTRHPHTPRNVNELHKNEQEQSGINQRLAVTITRGTGTMFCAYVFALLALAGFPALVGILGPVVALYVVWLSQTFIQLCMLPILSVGQAVLGHHAELQATEQYDTTMHSYHDIEQIIQHLDEQDKELLRHTALLIEMTKGRTSDGQ